MPSATVVVATALTSVTVKVVLRSVTVGVPLMTPVCGSSTRPVGNGGDTVNNVAVSPL